MKNVILVIKGFIMGIANIIPGVSGGTLALTMGIYEDFIAAISHFFKNLNKNLRFLIPVFAGMGLSILTMSNVISASFNNFPIPTTLFFMGLVIGGVPKLFHHVKGSKEMKKPTSYIIFILTFALVLVLAFSKEIFGGNLSDASMTNMHFTNYLMLSLVGIIAAATMVIPGVSGSLVLMLLGYYLPIINVIKDLTHFNNIWANVLIVGFFGIGVLLGIILISKIIEWLFKRFETKTYFGVLGFVSASVIAIPVAVMHEYPSIIFDLPHFMIGLLLMSFGIYIGYKLGEK